MRVLFRSSLLRCLSNIHFLEHFYDSFVASSPDVKRAFAHTDMERQMAMLNASLYQMMNLHEKRDDAAHAHMAALGAAHGKHGYGIPPALYDAWLESLMVAVKGCDPRYDDAIDAAWREVMRVGIEVMKANWHVEPARRADVDAAEAVAAVEVQRIVDRLLELSSEASGRSDHERDSEATAFQFGQYRAYLHASQVVHELLTKK
ncbi:MAG: globin domain-containing protein [Rhodothermales bacterium]|nr:globin domain-containing protein [Rhodothermales bacterium]